MKKCAICGKTLTKDESNNINPVCFPCQEIFAWMYNHLEYTNGCNRFQQVIDFLNKHEEVENEKEDEEE